MNQVRSAQTPPRPARGSGLVNDGIKLPGAAPACESEDHRDRDEEEVEVSPQKETQRPAYKRSTSLFKKKTQKKTTNIQS